MSPSLIEFTILGLYAVFLICFCIIFVSFLYSHIVGAPYVTTTIKQVMKIMHAYPFPHHAYVIELGSGDGRFLRYAAKEYKADGYGVDLNPVVIFWSNILARIDKVKIRFYRKNIFSVPLKDADVVYLFLLPEVIVKLKPKLEEELKKGSLVITHGFRIDGWEERLLYLLPDKPFFTFYYKM